MFIRIISNKLVCDIVILRDKNPLPIFIWISLDDFPANIFIHRKKNPIPFFIWIRLNNFPSNIRILRKTTPIPILVEIIFYDIPSNFKLPNTILFRFKRSQKAFLSNLVFRIPKSNRPVFLDLIDGQPFFSRFFFYEFIL